MRSRGAGGARMAEAGALDVDPRGRRRGGGGGGVERARGRGGGTMMRGGGGGGRRRRREDGAFRDAGPAGGAVGAAAGVAQLPFEGKR